MHYHLHFIHLSIPNVETYTLTIDVKNLRNTKGVVQFALYNKDGSIPDEDYENYYKILKGEIVNGSSTITFKNIPSGKYAINILHVIGKHKDKITFLEIKNHFYR